MEFVVGGILISTMAICYKYNKMYIYKNLLDKISKINLYINKHIKYPTKDFEILSAHLIYNDKIILNNENEDSSSNEDISENDINNFIYRKIDIKDLFLFTIMNIEKLDINIYNKLLNTFNINEDENTRIIIKYICMGNEYYLYWKGQPLDIPFYTNDSINNYKKIFLKNTDTRKSVYMLLQVELKNINNVYYVDYRGEQDVVINDNRLIELFNKLKGPMNDYGYLNNTLIKNKWLYQDFKLKDYHKLVIVQGLYMDNNINLISKYHDVYNNNDYLKLDLLDDI